MLDYNVTLGARVNPEGAQNAKKDDVGCTQSQSQATDTPQACQNNCAGGGIIALTSSPTENYSYYAKTVLTTKRMLFLILFIQLNFCKSSGCMN